MVFYTKFSTIAPLLAPHYTTLGSGIGQRCYVATIAACALVKALPLVSLIERPSCRDSLKARLCYVLTHIAVHPYEPRRKFTALVQCRQAGRLNSAFSGKHHLAFHQRTKTVLSKLLPDLPSYGFELNRVAILYKYTKYFWRRSSLGIAQHYLAKSGSCSRVVKHNS